IVNQCAGRRPTVAGEAEGHSSGDGANDARASVHAPNAIALLIGDRHVAIVVNDDSARESHIGVNGGATVAEFWKDDGCPARTSERFENSVEPDAAHPVVANLGYIQA